MTYNRKYTNGEITVYWQPDLCVHAGVCLTELPRVFNPRRRPWVDLSQSDTGSIIATVNGCPTNALMYAWNDPERNAKDQGEKVMHDSKLIDRFDKEKEAADNAKNFGVKVKLQPDGPVIITGVYELEHESGHKEIQSTPCSICRCGRSQMLPFCDGTHAISEK